MNAYEESSERRGNERRDREPSERHTFATGATLPFDPDSTWSTPGDDPDATYPLTRARN